MDEKKRLYKRRRYEDIVKRNILQIDDFLIGYFIEKITIIRILKGFEIE
jgi:hypothetical protein